MTEQIQKKMQKELENLGNIQKEYKKAIALKQKLDAQLNENLSVKSELAILNKDAEVYKLIGPVLIKQEQEEVKDNVTKRIEYIAKEIKRCDDHVSALENKQEALQGSLSGLKNELSKMKIKA